VDFPEFLFGFFSFSKDRSFFEESFSFFQEFVLLALMPLFLLVWGGYD